MASSEPVDYLPLLRLLTDAEVEFVVIGGVAGVMYGSPIPTFDVDIAIVRRKETLERIVQVLAPLNPRPRGMPDDLPFIFDVQTLRADSVLTLTTQLGDLDILSEPAGVDSVDGLLARAEIADMETFTLRVASLDDLIAMKRAANREKDQNPLEYLEALKAAGEEHL